jgi:aspartate dehydrogenase
MKEKKNKTKVGIVGCGTIGQELALRLTKSFEDSLILAFISDKDITKANELKKKISSPIAIVSIKELIKKSDFIIEAASAAVSFSIVAQCLKQNKSILVMSIGGLVLEEKKLRTLIKKSRGTVFLPSGALAGIDGVLAAKCSGHIKQVSLITRKPIGGLRGAPYFTMKKINLDAITKETVVFEGSAAEAIRYFPKNINVSALLSLAGIGPVKTKVKIVTSPDYTKNSHEIHVEGTFGKLMAVTENVPAPTNPKTSYLAILSAEATIAKIFSPLKIGT